MTNVVSASDLLKPCDARLMRSYPVSTRINLVANDDEEWFTSRETCRNSESSVLVVV